MSSANVKSKEARVKAAVLLDFDDTAAEQNVAELLLTRFGDSTWQDVRDRFRAGELNLREYQEITFRNIQADVSAMQLHVRNHASLRPYFNELGTYCQENDIPFAIVSQGLDFYIEALLAKEGHTQVPVYAVNTSFSSQGIAYEYRHTRPGQEKQGNSKGLVVEQYQEQGYHVFYAGDGMSDFEAAERVDVLYAHRTLAQECARTNIPFRPFTDFQNMLQAVQEFHANGFEA
ncbi:MAG: hypothetical protein BZY81_02235 [SAR202 cluster bacterium Io17-Chloro-G4]|nr:MAG: hypothetical protein BZY81_02235 [SAR202 cluster bacterium Io17-Chloro-G4]